MVIAGIPMEELRHTRAAQDWLAAGRQEGRQEGLQEGRRDEAAAPGFFDRLTPNKGHRAKGHANSIWLSPVAMSSNLGFSARELREIERLVQLNSVTLLRAWREFHG